MADHRSSARFTERERAALEYAERFVLDHESIDDALVARLRASFSDGEIVELSACIARHMGFGRITRVLRLDHDDHCPLPARPDGPAGAGDPGRPADPADGAGELGIERRPRGPRGAGTRHA